MPVGKESVQLTLVMPVKLKEELKKFAKSKRWSLSQAGVALIEEALGLTDSESEEGDKEKH